MLITPAIAIHLVSVLLAFVLGAALLTRRIKGDRWHRTAGWSWVLLMLSAALSSLWIPGFMRLSWIHVFTALTLISLPLGVIRARRGDIQGHGRTMTGLFVGGLVIAGVLAFAPGRTLHRAVALLF
jgi:uncharacterized membrane protein